MGGSIQDTYGKRAKGFKGGIANSNPTRSKNDVAATDLGVGKFVAASVDGATVLAGASSVVAGVVVKDSILVSSTIQAGKNATILKGGSIFVYCETAAVEGDSVFVRHTEDGSLEVGDVRNNVDGSNAASVKATFSETINSAGLVEIDLNL